MQTKILKKYPLDIFLFIVAIALSMLVPFLFGYLIDNIILRGENSNLLIWFGIALVLSIVSSITSFYFMSFATTKKSIKNSAKLSINSVSEMLKMPIPLFSKKEKSYYLNVVTNSSFSYGDIHANLYLGLIANIGAVLIILSVVFYINKAIGLVFLLYVPVVIIGTTFQGKKLATMQSDAIAKQDRFLSSLKTSIDYKREINILKAGEYFAGKFSENMRTWEKFILKLKFLKALLEEFPGMATNIFGAVYLLFAATLVQRAELSIGELVMGYQYLGLVAGPLSYIAYTFLSYRADEEHVVRVDELAEKTQVDIEYEKLKTNEDYLISAKKLKLYRDDDKEKMLFETDILCMKKKGLYVLKGPNGAGKSLLLNYIINSISSKWASGEISISKDIEDTAFLTYPLFFIEGNFRDNLFHKKYDLDLLKILNIDFEGKEIKTNPVNLSLGQQQKLGLLRVLSMNSNYVFLDEPFSNLDVETQKNITEYINELKKTKTVVVITHDETLDSLADEIYIIKSKQLELIKADGIRSFAN